MLDHFWPVFVAVVGVALVPLAHADRISDNDCARIKRWVTGVPEGPNQGETLLSDEYFATYFGKPRGRLPPNQMAYLRNAAKTACPTWGKMTATQLATAQQLLAMDPREAKVGQASSETSGPDVTAPTNNAGDKNLSPGHYAGTFYCSGRIIPIKFEIAESPEGQKSGRLRFSGGTISEESFTFFVEDYLDGGSLLTAVAWLDHPGNSHWNLFNVEGVWTGNAFSGRGIHDGCGYGNIDAAKVGPPSSPTEGARVWATAKQVLFPDVIGLIPGLPKIGLGMTIDKALIESASANWEDYGNNKRRQFKSEDKLLIPGSTKTAYFLGFARPNKADSRPLQKIYVEAYFPNGPKLDNFVAELARMLDQQLVRTPYSSTEDYYYCTKDMRSSFAFEREVYRHSEVTKVEIRWTGGKEGDCKPAFLISRDSRTEASLRDKSVGDPTTQKERASCVITHHWQTQPPGIVQVYTPTGWPNGWAFIHPAVSHYGVKNLCKVPITVTCDSPEKSKTLGLQEELDCGSLWSSWTVK